MAYIILCIDVYVIDEDKEKDLCYYVNIMMSKKHFKLLNFFLSNNLRDFFFQI